MNSTRIPYYLDYLPAALLNALAEVAVPVDGVPGLQVTPGLQARFPSIETTEALRFVCSLYEATREPLATVLEQRAVDRAFIDQKLSNSLIKINISPLIRRTMRRYSDARTTADASLSVHENNGLQLLTSRFPPICKVSK